MFRTLGVPWLDTQILKLPCKACRSQNTKTRHPTMCVLLEYIFPIHLMVIIVLCTNFVCNSLIVQKMAEKKFWLALKKILGNFPIFSVIDRNKIKQNLAAQYRARIRHEGLKKSEAGEKGFGVFTTRRFLKGEYLCEYEGRVQQVSDTKDGTEGNYLFDFKCGPKHYRLLFNI